MNHRIDVQTGLTRSRGSAAGQLVDLAADEGIGEGGVAADERLGELVDGLLDEAVELRRG